MYMSDGETLDVAVSGDRRKAGLRNYEKAMKGVSRAEFNPHPTEWHCPHCPGYHICPAAETSPESELST